MQKGSFLEGTLDYLKCCFRRLFYESTVSVGEAKTGGEGLLQELVLSAAPVLPNYTSYSTSGTEARNCLSNQAVEVTQQVSPRGGGPLGKVAA